MDGNNQDEARNALLERCRRLTRTAEHLFRDVAEATPDQLPRIEREVRTMEGRDGGDAR